MNYAKKCLEMLLDRTKCVGLLADPNLDLDNKYKYTRQLDHVNKYLDYIIDALVQYSDFDGALQGKVYPPVHLFYRYVASFELVSDNHHQWIRLILGFIDHEDNILMMTNVNITSSLLTDIPVVTFEYEDRHLGFFNQAYQSLTNAQSRFELCISEFFAFNIK